MQKTNLLTILFPIGSLYPAQSGGPSNTIYWLAKALVKQGVSVKIITTNKDIKPELIELDKWHYFDYGQVRYCKTQIIYLPISLIYHSWRALKNVDIVHLTALFYPPSLIIAFISVLYKKTIIWSVRGELHYSALRYNKIRKNIYLFFIKLLSKKKITFHATSNFEAELINKQFGKEIPVIELQNFIELPKTILPTNRNIYLLFVGRIHPIKALDNIIEGMASSIYFKDSKYSFKIIGDGDSNYTKYLKEKIVKLGLESKIYFLGRKSGIEKQKLFANSRYTLLLSHSENFGNVVVESLSQGTPVICSFGTPWQSIEQKKAGFWIDNSPQSIAKMIDILIYQDQKDYDKMRANARKLSLDEFDISKNIDKWINVYISLSK